MVEYIHKHGVNVRHIGLLRSYIPIDDSTAEIRKSLLLEMVSRTIKNIVREVRFGCRIQ